MNGQWIGRYTGSNTGLLVVEIDDMGTHYEGRAFAYDDNPLLPGTVVLIKTPDKAKHYQQNLELFPINPPPRGRSKFLESLRLPPGAFAVSGPRRLRHWNLG